MKDYFDKLSGFTEYICYKCGNYVSNSPAYRSNPEGFKNLVRDDPSVLKRIIARNPPKGNSYKSNRRRNSTLKQ